MTHLECLYRVLDLLNDVCTSECSMGIEDVDTLCEARELVATTVNARYNEDTNRFERTE